MPLSSAVLAFCLRFKFLELLPAIFDRQIGGTNRVLAFAFASSLTAFGNEGYMVVLDETGATLGVIEAIWA